MLCEIEVSHVDDRWIDAFGAGSFDFFTVEGIERYRALGAIFLDELNADNTAAAIENEVFDRFDLFAGFLRQESHDLVVVGL